VKYAKRPDYGDEVVNGLTGNPRPLGRKYLLVNDDTARPYRVIDVRPTNFYGFEVWVERSLPIGPSRRYRWYEKAEDWVYGRPSIQRLRNALHHTLERTP
jgi:hypothetical protein